jgi:hypothetical protein
MKYISNATAQAMHAEQTMITYRDAIVREAKARGATVWECDDEICITEPARLDTIATRVTVGAPRLSTLDRLRRALRRGWLRLV